MKPWIKLATGTTPQGHGFELLARDGEYSILVQGKVLMGSRQFESERQLAELALTPRPEAPYRRVLVGGLGFGYTLRAALDRVGTECEVTLVELMPFLVALNRGPLAELCGAPLADARVKVIEGDIVEHLRAAPPPRYDAILLDVDNGPHALTQSGNAWLYGAKGLRRLHDCLEPGGVLAVWSAAPDDAFTERLRANGYAPECHAVRARDGKRGARHTVWVAARK